MATLGGLIKDFRIQKRISQLEVATKVGWSDTTRLSKIEQGRTNKPTRSVTDRILDALGISEGEKNELLLFGGYIPDPAEIKKATNDVSEKIDNWPYPSYLIDFTWRLLYSNIPGTKTFYAPSNQVLRKGGVNLLEFPFFPDLPLEIYKGEDENNVAPFTVAQIGQFKIEEHIRSEESWYRKLIGRLMKNETFRQTWAKVTSNTYKKKLVDYEYKIVKGSWTGKKQTLRFHILTSKLISDPRFQLVMYLPVNKETENFYANKSYLKAQ